MTHEHPHDRAKPESTDTSTIYQKLDVHGRRQAVARAEELGLL